jgi:hypothetical protein
MKKTIIWIWALTLAGTTFSEGLVNGDFSSATLTPLDNKEAMKVGGGWNNPRKMWAIVGGQAVRTGNDAKRAMAQAFTFAGTGTQTLYFNFLNAASGTVENSQVYLIGIDGAGPFQFNGNEDTLRIADLFTASKQLQGGGNYTATRLIDQVVTSVGGDGLFSASFTADPKYECYYFAVASGNNKSGSFTIDNVEVTLGGAAPSPVAKRSVIAPPEVVPKKAKASPPKKNSVLFVLK